MSQPPMQGGYAPPMQGGYNPPGAMQPQYTQNMAGQPFPQQPLQQPGQFQQAVQYQQQPAQFQQQPAQFQQQPTQFQQQPTQFQQQPGSQYMQPGAHTSTAPSGSVQPSAPVQWDPKNAQQYDGDVGQEDVDESAAVEPNEASAPPPPMDLSLPGYEAVAYTNELPAGPPPSYQDATGEDATVDLGKLSTITAEDAKEALLEYVAQQCCHGSGAAKDMSIKDIQSSSAYHYTLETFTEGRSTKWHHVPYSGGFVDGPHNGPAPGPWDVVCGFNALFKNEVKKIEIPHTASVKPCFACFGRGFKRCWMCHGRGRVRCSFCSGTGRRHVHRDGRTHHESCSSCHGHGRKRCHTCFGTGCVRCRECHGFAQLKHYIQLTVTFSNRLSDHIVERSDLPDELIRNVSGDVILEQIAIRVGPVQNFLEQEINQRSNAIVGTHAISWPNERILQQRQILRVVPVYECAFEHKDKGGRFWVYGKQNTVYTQDYPHTCCCCSCAIL